MALYDFISQKFFKKSLNHSAQEENEEIPLWVGPGDLFLAIIIGGTLGVVHGVVAFFFAYVVGSIISIAIIIFSRKKASHEIPFGPFLGIGFFLAILFYEQINNFVNTYFLYLW